MNRTYDTPPRGLAALDAPCWVLRLPGGTNGSMDVDVDVHYPTEEEARAMIGAYLPEDDRNEVPVQQGFRCWTATAACGLQYDVEGEGVVAHGVSAQAILNDVTHAEWIIGTGNVMLCDQPERCEGCRPLVPEKSEDEGDGQQALI